MGQPGRDAYHGFEYQIRVSTWLALVFLVEQKLAEEVAVEPLSGEDLEILRSGKADHDTSELATTMQVDARSLHRFIIQIKGRRAGHWTPGELATILEGDARKDAGETPRRAWPIQIMRQEPNAALLFVTDSTVSDVLPWFLVETPIFAPHSEPRPNMAKRWGDVLSAIDDGVLARVGVLQGRRHDYVEQRIDDILARELHVPHSQRPDCRDALFARFRAAMLANDAAQVRSDEIRTIAVRHHGLPGGPDPFVEPANWADIQRFLREKHAIVLIGEPGSGKSTAAERLVYEHQVLPEPFQAVKPLSPAELGKLGQATEPVIIYVEDPFGRYRPRDDDEEWRVELERFCSKVRDDLKLVVTSRAAFAERYLDDDKAGARLRRYRFSFDGELFDRYALLKKHLDKENLPDPDPRAWIESNAAMIVAIIGRPFSYSVFVPRAASVPAGQRSDARLEQIAQGASNAELGKDLEKTFEHEPEGILRGLAAIWLAFDAWPYEPRVQERLTQFEEALLDIEAEVSGAKAKLLEHRWLHVRDSVMSMHPIYLEACLRVLEGRRALTIRVVESVLRMYSARREVGEVEAIFRAVTGRKFVRESMQRELSSFASDCLQSSASTERRGVVFASSLRILAANRQAGDPMAMLASALCQGLTPSGRGGLLFIEEWYPPSWAGDAVLRKVVAEHPDTPAVVRAFVRRGFPTIVDGWYFGASRLVDFLYGLVDVSVEFDSLLEGIDEFRNFLVDVIAIGAAHSRNADPDRLLARAFAEERAYETWVRECYPYDEDSYAASEHLGELADERERPAKALVDAVLEVQAILGDRAWAATRRELLVFQRFAERVQLRKEGNGAIIRQVFDACPSETRAEVCEAVFGNETLFDLALDLLPQVPSHQWREILDRRLLNHFDAQTQRSRLARALDVMRASSEALAPHERVSLAHAFHDVRAYSTLRDTIVGQLGEIERAALSVLLNEPDVSAQRCADLLEQVADSKFSAAHKALVALARDGRLVEDRVDAWLSPEGRIDDAIAALDAVAAAPSPKSLVRARRGLAHHRASVRSRALVLLGEIPGDGALDAILSIEDEPTATVKIASAEALAGRTEARAWRALVSLLADATDTSEAARHGEGWHDDHYPEYGVAVAAAHALAALDPWPEELKTVVDGFLASASSTRTVVAATLRRHQKATPRAT